MPLQWMVIKLAAELRLRQRRMWHPRKLHLRNLRLSAHPAAPSAHPGESREPRGEAGGSGRIKASPLAKRLAKDAELDLAAIAGSGPNGRIVKADVEAAKAGGMAKAAPAQAPAPQAQTAPTSTEVGMPLGGGAEYLEKMGITPGSYSLEPLDGMRRTVAKRLSSSNVNVPDFPLTIDCEIDALLAMRKELNGQVPEGVKISVNDMLIRASALALKHMPEANASFTPDGIAYHNNADVAVAVAIDGGLITPVIRHADRKGLTELSSETRELATKARNRELQPEDWSGSTFSTSNLGMFGIDEFTAIINPPNACILAIGSIRDVPVVRDGVVVPGKQMKVTLSCDHRVVDGASGAEFLKTVRGYLEDPVTMLL